MSPTIASAIFAVGIVGLFLLNREPGVRTSKALWIPVIWVFIAGSRAPGTWFQAPSQVAAADQFMEGNPFERNLFSVLLVIAFVVVFMRGRKAWEVLRKNIPILLFLFYCAVSLLWADYPVVGFKRWTKLVGDLAMVAIVVTDINPSAAFNRLVTRTGFLIVPISILFIRYYPDLGRTYGAWDGTMMWTGVTTNKNTLGMICMILGLGTLWRVIRAFKSRKTRSRSRLLIAHGVILVMVIYLLYEARSATASSCFYLGSAIILAISFFRTARKPLTMHLLAIGAVLLAACATFFNIGGLLQDLGRKADLTGRTELWAIVLSQPVNHLIGTGYENFWLGERLVTVTSLAHQYVIEAHDGYVELLINLGWLGISFFALIIMTGYAKITRAVRLDPEGNCLRLAYFVAAIIYNFSEAGFKMTSPVWIFFLWAIVSVPAVSKTRDLPAPEADIDSTRMPSEPEASPVLVRRERQAAFRAF